MLSIVNQIAMNNDYRNASAVDSINFVNPSFAPAGYGCDIDNGELRW